LLVVCANSVATAQATRQQEGLVVREIAVSTGYGSVQLPPITLSGILPPDAFNADSITTAEGALNWKNVTHRSIYRIDVEGNYTARVKYPEMNSFGGTAALGMSRTFGRNWRASLGANSALTSSEQGAFMPTPAQQLAGSDGTVEELSNRLASARSPNPDAGQGSLFVPINQSVAANDQYGNQILSNAATAGLTYANTSRLSTTFGVGYASMKRVGPSHEPGLALPFPDSSVESLGGEVSFAVTRRTKLAGNVDWSRSIGAFNDEVTSAGASYQWTGRKWFSQAGVGLGIRPGPRGGTQESASLEKRSYGIKYDLHLGYRGTTHTFLAGNTRGFRDGYGYGSRNAVTGFGGGVWSVEGLWNWEPLNSRWNMQTDFSLFRSPGNFSFIYTWLETTHIGFRLASNFQMRGEFIFDRHGSRAFEGFHLSREGVRVNFVWTPGFRLL
jgi:hypothetical protein